MTVKGARLSEDYSFCHRWRQCGGEVWANISHPITHVGLHRYAGRYQDAMPRGPRIVVGNVPAMTAGKQGASKPSATKNMELLSIKEGGLRATVAAPKRVPAPKRVTAQLVSPTSLPPRAP